MHNVDEAGITKATSDTPVILNVAAEFEQLPVVRAVAETLAVLGDYVLDEVADVKLAVDEVCSDLVAAASADSTLTCAFSVSRTEFRVTVGAVVERDDIPDREGFGWHVLETLMTEVEVSRASDSADGQMVTTVELVKRKNTQ